MLSSMTLPTAPLVLIGDDITLPLLHSLVSGLRVQPIPCSLAQGAAAHGAAERPRGHVGYLLMLWRHGCHGDLSARLQRDVVRTRQLHAIVDIFRSIFLVQAFACAEMGPGGHTMAELQLGTGTRMIVAPALGRGWRVGTSK